MSWFLSLYPWGREISPKNNLQTTLVSLVLVGGTGAGVTAQSQPVSPARLAVQVSEGQAALLLVAPAGQDHEPGVIRQTSSSVEVDVAPVFVVVAAIVVLLVGGVAVLGLHDQVSYSAPFYCPLGRGQDQEMEQGQVSRRSGPRCRYSC